MTSCMQIQAGADRFLRQRFATSPSKAPVPALPEASRVATAWSAGFADSCLCPRLFFGLMSSLYSGVYLIYGWRGEKEI